jgi:hypothetical protein
MIHIITNHHETLKWLNLQSEYLENNTSEDYKVYCGTTDIIDGDTSQKTFKNYSFYELKSVVNRHADKLNALVEKIETNGIVANDDLLVFLDPDALLIQPGWEKKLKDFILNKGVPIVAICREENIEPLLREEQKNYPHPCFLATSVGFWRNNNLSWDLDPSQGASCAGVLLKKWLDNKGIKWGKLLRSNCFNLHPLNFGVYGNMIYHHGSGNRPTYDSIDVFSRPELASKYGVSLDLHFPELLNFNDNLSNLVFEEVSKNADFIRMYFCGRDRL